MTCDGRTFGNSYLDFAIASHFLFFYASHTVPDAIESESADLILIINEFFYSAGVFFLGFLDPSNQFFRLTQLFFRLTENFSDLAKYVLIHVNFH